MFLIKLTCKVLEFALFLHDFEDLPQGLPTFDFEYVLASLQTLVLSMRPSLHLQSIKNLLQHNASSLFTGLIIQKFK